MRTNSDSYTIGPPLTLRGLLERYGQVRIPIIQRDYVQGLDSEGETRREFLRVLRDAVSDSSNDLKPPVNLDFIYGNIKDGQRTSFLPLDGQQRLTTLFLLHWYLAWRDREHDLFDRLFRGDRGCRFSYSVRTSSAEFFDALSAFRPDTNATGAVCVSALIKDQPWYFRHWRLDPTIRAATEMLDAIHIDFMDCAGGFLRLVDPEKPAITFQLLELREFGLSDDLYIKMNARGKGLTEFEAFKARYREHIEAQFDGESRRLSGEDIPVAEYFVRRMDTVWSDLFWRYRRKGASSCDREIMNLIRVVAMASRNPGEEQYTKRISALRDHRNPATFSTLDRYGCLDRRLSETLLLLLDTWSGSNGSFAAQLTESRPFNELGFFRRAISRPTDVGYAELVQLVGFIAFLEANDTLTSQASLYDWMRIIVNLSTNTAYDGPSDLQRSVRGIAALSHRSGEVLEYFVNHERPVVGFNEQQIEEERLKAELISAGYRWRPLIETAERHGYFKGQIGFLLDFCGARDAWATGQHEGWSAAGHRDVQREFRRYLRAAKTMFTPKGLSDVGENRWERALLTLGKYLLRRWLNYSFLVNATTENASWKGLLRASNRESAASRMLLQRLWDRLDHDGNIADQLDKMIYAASGLEEWREALVKTSEAIAYCGMREIRWESEDEIYLLRKRQMNGAHAELFTYCLFVAGKLEDALPDTVNVEYMFPTDTYTRPGIVMRWVQNSRRVVLTLERSGIDYVVTVCQHGPANGASVEWQVPESAGLKETDGMLRKEIGTSRVEEAVAGLVRVLTRASAEA